MRVALRLFGREVVGVDLTADAEPAARGPGDALTDAHEVPPVSTGLGFAPPAVEPAEWDD